MSSYFIPSMSFSIKHFAVFGGQPVHRVLQLGFFLGPLAAPRRLDVLRRIVRFDPALGPTASRLTVARFFRFKLIAVLNAIRYSQVKNSASPLNVWSDWYAFRNAS